MNSLSLAVSAASGTAWNFWFASTFVGLLAVIAILAAALKQGSRRWWVFTILAGLLAAACTLTEGWTRTILLDAAALCGVFLVWDTGTEAARKAARNYLVFLALSMVFIAAGLAITGNGLATPAGFTAKLAAVLFLVGFGLKLALVPFYFWLPAVAQTASPLTTALIVGLVDMASFFELCQLRSEAAWLFQDYYGIWLALALLSMFGGALLALAQRDVKRMLAFSTIDDLGYLVLGVLAGSQTGMAGAEFGALSHAIFKVLLFGAVAVAESRIGHSLTLDDRGLAARFPTSGAAFIIGALGMIGVPPTLGFIGRWRLYLSGTQLGGALLALTMAAATALALLYYVRAIHRIWLGKPDGNAVSGEPAAAKWVLVVVCVLVIAAGVYPGLWTGMLP